MAAKNTKENDVDLFGDIIEDRVLLRDKFQEPPFSVLDTKQKSWRDRKNMWKGLGIQSEVGRDVTCNPVFGDEFGREELPSVSIFDPVLTEVCYKWFSPPNGKILDVFAGGSVRGIVAGYLGYKYTGIDIRHEQTTSNIDQSDRILNRDDYEKPVWITGDSNEVLKHLNGRGYTSDPEAITPVQRIGNIFLKRDDLFSCNGARGGKVRTCLALAKSNPDPRVPLITAGSRMSPQIGIVSRVAQHLGKQSYAHCPEGEVSPVIKDAMERGLELKQHKAGYNSVIIKRARDHAAEINGTEIPFGMECMTAVTETARQVENIPDDTVRIVVPVGSGMSLAGILQGLIDFNKNISVLGIVVGADPEKRLDAFAPLGWRSMVTLVPAGVDYHKSVDASIGGVVDLDPIYEAKCKPFLEDGDLLWIVGNRSDLKPVEQFDFAFTCPPYGDLEVYSDLPADISNMDYPDFIDAMESIIRKSIKLLKTGAYYGIVIGDFRDKFGYYRGFVADIINIFRGAGMVLYNDGVLLTPLGSAMLRASNTMKNQKLVKVHQNLLVFKKV